MRGLVYLHVPHKSATLKATFPVLQTLSCREQGQGTKQTWRTVLILIASSEHYLHQHLCSFLPKSVTVTKTQALGSPCLCSNSERISKCTNGSCQFKITKVRKALTLSPLDLETYFLGTSQVPKAVDFISRVRYALQDRHVVYSMGLIYMMRRKQA